MNNIRSVATFLGFENKIQHYPAVVVGGSPRSMFFFPKADMFFSKNDVSFLKFLLNNALLIVSAQYSTEKLCAGRRSIGMESAQSS